MYVIVINQNGFIISNSDELKLKFIFYAGKVAPLICC